MCVNGFILLLPERHKLNFNVFPDSSMWFIFVLRMWLFSYKCDVVCMLSMLLSIINWSVSSLNSSLIIECAKGTKGTFKKYRYTTESDNPGVNTYIASPFYFWMVHQDYIKICMLTFHDHHFPPNSSICCYYSTLLLQGITGYASL